MIGLVDWDLQSATSVNLHPPNLEIMKLATYYKIEKQQFCRLIPLNDKELSAYEKIYFFSEAETPPKVPEQFMRANNIVFGGTGFTNGIYVPFEDELIDFTLAKPNIYKEFLKQCYQDGIKAKVISHILDDSYYRHYAGANELPVPPIQPKRRLWVYDKDLCQNNWRQWVDIAAERKCSAIYTIHPIICKNMTDYINVRKSKIARTNIVILDLDIPLEDTKYLFKEYKNYFLGDITKESKVCLKIGGTLKTNFQYYKDLIYKLNLLYCFWGNKIPIKLKYIPPQVGVNCCITNLLNAIELWANSDNRSKTINDRIIKKKMKEPAQEYAEELLVLKFHPTAADLFKQNYTDLSNRGFWRI